MMLYDVDGVKDDKETDTDRLVRSLAAIVNEEVDDDDVDDVE